jgi:outer membrane protein assembly factor BamB
MKTSELIFIGIKGSVVALDRATGKQVWATHLKGSDFVNVILDQDQVVATCYGEVFCLDPYTGDSLWHNPLKGFGTGLATMGGGSQQSALQTPLLSEKRRREEAAAAAGAAAAAA